MGCSRRQKMPLDQQDLLKSLNAGGGGGGMPRTGSTLQATVALFKAVVGTGVFAYPPACRQAGYVLATMVAVFFFVINLYTMRVLNYAIVAMREAGYGADRDGRIEYHALTAHIFTPVVNAGFLAVAMVGQLGTLASMTVFVVDQLVPLKQGLQGWQVAFGMAIFVAPLCCLRTTDAKPFQLAMQAGSIAVLTAMGTLVWYGAVPNGGFDEEEVEALTEYDWTGLATAFSISGKIGPHDADESLQFLPFC